MYDKRNIPTDAHEQALEIREAWNNIDRTAKYGSVTLTEFDALINETSAAEAAVTSLEDQLAAARQDLWAKKSALWEMVKRARSGAKAQHGDNSSEYERFGGTPMSARRRRRTTTDRESST